MALTISSPGCVFSRTVAIFASMYPRCCYNSGSGAAVSACARKEAHVVHTLFTGATGRLLIDMMATTHLRAD